MNDPKIQKFLNKLESVIKQQEFYIYTTLSMLDQYCIGPCDSDTGNTQYNIEAAAVNKLSELGYVEIIFGNWPNTKYLTFKITEKGRDFMNNYSGER